MNTKELEKKARQVRLEALEAAVLSGKGHLGGTYSCVELLIALYYGGVLRIDPRNPKDRDRDRFILSKGHACAALYSIFKDLGIISEERYQSYGKDGGLGGQLDITMPGIDFNTGSLGHAIGVGAGMALSAKKDSKDYCVFTIVGDSELFEGSMWEAIIFAREHKLNNLVVIIDRNRLSVTAAIEDDTIFENFQTKVEGFGWQYYELDGHNFDEIFTVFEKVRTSKKPVMIVANTVKGKGVSFMENRREWHHGVPPPEKVEIARQELGGE